MNEIVNGSEVLSNVDFPHESSSFTSLRHSSSHLTTVQHLLDGYAGGLPLLDHFSLVFAPTCPLPQAPNFRQNCSFTFATDFLHAWNAASTSVFAAMSSAPRAPNTASKLHTLSNPFPRGGGCGPKAEKTHLGWWASAPERPLPPPIWCADPSAPTDVRKKMTETFTEWMLLNQKGSIQNLVLSSSSLVHPFS